MTEEKKKSIHPISRTLCEAYSVLVENREVAFALQDTQIDKLDAIVGTIEGSWFGVSHFDSDEKKGAAYFCFIIKDHPLVDGNKRLSVLWLQIFCHARQLEIKLPPDMTLDKLAVSIEASPMNMEELCEVVRKILF